MPRAKVGSVLTLSQFGLLSHKTRPMNVPMEGRQPVLVWCTGNDRYRCPVTVGLRYRSRAFALPKAAEPGISPCDLLGQESTGLVGVRHSEGVHDQRVGDLVGEPVGPHDHSG